MGFRALLFGGLLAIAASAGMAQPQDPARTEMLRALLQGNDCVLTEAEADIILPPLEFGPEETRAIVGALVAAGTVRLDGSTLTLVDGSCSGGTGADAAPEGLFLAVMAENGCEMAEADARSLMPAAGLRMDQAYRIADAMVAAGEATYSDSGAVLQISSARCAASDRPAALPEAGLATPAEAPAENMETKDPRAGVLAMLAANNCEVSQSNVGAMIGAAGLEFGPTIQILSQMMADGTATSPDGGQTLQVAPPLCVVAVATTATPRDIFINLIKQNNCSLTASEFSALLPVEGLDASTAFGLVEELEAAGDIYLPPTRDIVTLSAENCR